jgi:hypothetical protein
MMARERRPTGGCHFYSFRQSSRGPLSPTRGRQAAGPVQAAMMASLLYLSLLSQRKIKARNDAVAAVECADPDSRPQIKT